MRYSGKAGAAGVGPLADQRLVDCLRLRTEAALGEGLRRGHGAAGKHRPRHSQAPPPPTATIEMYRKRLRVYTRRRRLRHARYQLLLLGVESASRLLGPSVVLPYVVWWSLSAADLAGAPLGSPTTRGGNTAGYRIRNGAFHRGMLASAVLGSLPSSASRTPPPVGINADAARSTGHFPIDLSGSEHALGGTIMRRRRLRWRDSSGHLQWFSSIATSYDRPGV